VCTRERDRRRAHREPERGANDRQPLTVGLRAEVEAEERALDSGPKEREDDRRQRDERLDRPVVRGREEARVEREQEDGDEPLDQAADAVDRGVLA
jgi:hypothetical protein